MLYGESQDSGRVGAEHCRFLAGTQAYAFDKTHRLFITHVEAVVAAQYQMVDTDVGDQIVQHRPGMRHCVIAESR